MVCLKKLTAILFLALFFISSNAEWVASFINAIQMQQRIASAMAYSINEDKLQTFSFTESEFAKQPYSPANKEITIAGKNYDIADIKKVNELVIIRCLADEKEMQIKLWAKKNEQQKSQQIEKAFSKIYTLQTNTTILQIVSSEISSKLFYYNCSVPQNVYLDIIVPPPTLA